MLSSNRRALRLSTHIASVALAVLLLGGCPDPAGELQAFVERLPDATVVVMADAPVVDVVPDVSGPFLSGLPNDLLSASGPIRFLSTQTVDMSGGMYKVTLSFQPLDKTTYLPVGDPAAFPPVMVSKTTGEFDVSLSGMLTIPAAANTLLPAPIVAQNVQVHGRIVSKDRHCGTLTGMVTMPVPADLAVVHTTYGAIRVDPGTTGTNLPPPEIKCP